jgi:hypothetical protein
MGLFPPLHPRTWAMLGAQWHWVILQCALTLLPPAWLWFARRRGEI